LTETGRQWVSYYCHSVNSVQYSQTQLEDVFAKCTSFADALLAVNRLGIEAGTITIMSPMAHGWVTFHGKSVKKAYLAETKQTGRAALRALSTAQSATYRYLPPSDEKELPEARAMQPGSAPLPFEDKIIMRTDEQVVVFRVPNFEDNANKSLMDDMEEIVIRDYEERAENKFTNPQNARFQSQEDWSDQQRIDLSAEKILAEAGFSDDFSPTKQTRFRAFSHAGLEEDVRTTSVVPLFAVIVVVSIVSVGGFIFFTKQSEEAASKSGAKGGSHAATLGENATQVALPMVATAPPVSSNGPRSRDLLDMLEYEYHGNPHSMQTLEKLVRLHLGRRNYKRARKFAAIGFASPDCTPEQRAMFYQLYKHALKGYS
jgi:hypothetical protein